MVDIDVELMLEIKAGSKSAFNKLVKRHQRMVINFFYKNLWDKSQAEDMAQELFLRLFKSAKNYQPQAKFTTFMYRVARNLLIDYYRSTRNKPGTVSLQGGSSSGNDDELQIIDTISSSESQPGQHSESLEIGEAIQEAISKLPEDQRVVFIMGEFERMQYKEIAKALDIPIGTVKSRMHAAFIKLRKLLAKYSPDD
ncbi:MAG: sigma-70 family RNA polymerase sigma factor [Planctomycetes bacterium]|nr:sigma-70 family RNA polymerase sigma factor [Planctomycetota bacterium]